MKAMWGTLLCLIRFHDWDWHHTDGGDRYQACTRCGKEKPDLVGRTGIIM